MDVQYDKSCHPHLKRHTETFKTFVQRYLGREWRAPDGLSRKIVDKAEARLGIRIPSSLKCFYLTLGAVPELCSIHNIIFGPEGLEVDEGYLIFMDENQSVVLWGIKKRDLKKSDPIIWQRNNTSDEWYSEEKTLAELLASMFDWYESLGVLRPVAARPNERLRRKERGARGQT
jgi:hypothetical protein